MQEKNINDGDLVCLDLSNVDVPGALTAVKFYQRLQNECGSMTGIVVDSRGTHAIVVFNNYLRKVISKKFLQVIQECK
jgi:hypothetical protein